MDNSRESFVRNLRALLIGPSTADELISTNPCDQYLYGYLWPSFRNNPVKDLNLELEDDDLEDMSSQYSSPLGDDKEGTDFNESIPLGQKYKQCSLGLSFQVPSNADRIVAHIKYGKYEYDSDAHEWKRQEYLYDYRLSIKSARHKISDDISLDLICHKNTGIYLCTATLINITEENPDDNRMAQAEKCIFQPELRLTLEPLGLQFSPRPLPVTRRLSNESKMYEMLYLKKRPAAFGHGVSATWNEELTTIYSSFVPTFEVNPVDKECSHIFKDNSAKALNCKYLGYADKETLINSLKKFASSYDDWIGSLAESELLKDSFFKNTADDNLANCKKALSRIRVSIQALNEDSKFLKSFQLANRSIDLQNQWKSGKESGSFCWRPFQLGFFLLVIESFISPNQASLDVADLLWFPTGGGKTEAYLGIISFLLFHGSTEPQHECDPGTQVLIRYTLRLLTKQQFDRAAAVTLASNFIRKESEFSDRDSKEFSIGLWIGAKATPNSRKDAVKALSYQEIQPSDPRQYNTCPCCKSPLTWSNDQRSPIQPSCHSKDCLLQGDLPIYTVDEDIYNVRPSIVLGTSDKFVQLVEKPHAGNIFRSTTGKRPQLILQDELHLISGPLGSISGLYETAIDLICSETRKVKVIGSTATIKNATSQIKSLFCRESLQFPPPGIEYSDSCFAIENPNEDGRLYIGVSSTGRSPKYALQAVAAACVHIGKEMYKCNTNNDLLDQLDTYTTIVGYFNSLKELGGASVLFQDDVNDSLENISKYLDEQKNGINEVVELTSTRSQEELQRILQRLELAYETGESIDACLSTNMISVGVDVSRLGLMLVNGQPKSKSEYIQATSRVGRSYPGIVVTLYNDSKVRDKSGFEAFQAIHQSLYKDVEIMSVTPFSPQCIDKALATVLIATVRHLIPEAVDNPNLTDYKNKVIRIAENIISRCKSVSPENESFLQEKLDNMLLDWEEYSPSEYIKPMRSNRATNTDILPLLTRAEIASGLQKDEYLFSSLTNVRSVEAQTRLSPSRPKRRSR